MAGLIEALIAGGMMSWAYRDEGTAAQWVGGLMEDVLAPWLDRQGETG